MHMAWQLQVYLFTSFYRNPAPSKYRIPKDMLQNPERIGTKSIELTQPLGSGSKLLVLTHCFSLENFFLLSELLMFQSI